MRNQQALILVSALIGAVWLFSFVHSAVYIQEENAVSIQGDNEGNNSNLRSKRIEIEEQPGQHDQQHKKKKDHEKNRLEQEQEQKQEQKQEPEQPKLVWRQRESRANLPPNDQDLEKKGLAHIPIVLMAYNRPDYLEETFKSLLASDLPAGNPVIVSHDGHVPETMELVERYKSSLNISQIFHPHACYDHPHSFPGDAPELNIGYKGDTYKNPRSNWATCAKHHWWWMMRQVFLQYGDDYPALLISEEDYIVAPTIFESMHTGLGLCVDPECFGIILLCILGQGRNARPMTGDGWVTDVFQTGPMVLRPSMWERIWSLKNEFCKYDDYNWDWSVVNLMHRHGLPGMTVVSETPQVRHIGISGMHGKEVLKGAAAQVDSFHGTVLKRKPVKIKPSRPNGGWGHPKDQQHCMALA